MKVLSICFALLCGLAMAGCSYKPTPVAVYGRSGATYSAPTLCEALLKCQSNEAACLYNSTTVVDMQGRSESDTCKEVKK